MKTEENAKMVCNHLNLPFYYQNVRSKNGTEQGRQRMNGRCNVMKEMMTSNNVELAWFGEGRLKSSEKLHPPAGCELMRTNGPSGSFGMRKKNTDVMHIDIENNNYDVSFFTHNIKKQQISTTV